MATTTNNNSATNPCTLVRQSCYQYVKEDQCQRHVKIHQDAIPRLAQEMIAQQQQQQQQLQPTTASPQLVEWDEEDWHYSIRPSSSSSIPDTNTSTTVMDDGKITVNTATWPVSIRIERTALYILALDAINFCFWKPQQDSTNSVNSMNNDSTSSTYKYEYEDLARTLTNMAVSDHAHQQGQPQVLSTEYLLSPMHLQNLTPDRMIMLFQKYHPKNTDNSPGTTTNEEEYIPPYMEERCRIWNEIGTVLMNPPFHGSILPLFQMVQEVQQPQQSKASRMVQLLLDSFPNFRDDTKERYLHHRVRVHDGVTTTPPSETAVSLLYFYKRAQICVGDLYAALASAKLLFNEQGDDINMDDITTFADYRVPQILRHYQILEYSTPLAQRIDSYEELYSHSDEEYAIRASTIVAVELLVDELRRRQSTGSVSWNAMQADWYLWQLGEKMEQKNELLPHHRVRTTFY